MPRKQWRCFHCDQVFTSERWAREHFGDDFYSYPACRIAHHEGSLVSYIRKLEAEVHDHRSENHEVLLSAYSLMAEARGVESAAEQRGYDKGVKETYELLAPNALSASTGGEE